MAKTEEVFGVSSKQVLSYIVRPDVDNKFFQALKSDKQVVVYGASKQGKTALVSKYLPYEKNLPISVTPRTEIIDIYSSILRQLNVRIQTSSIETSSHETHATLGMRFKAFIPLFGSGEVKGNAGAKLKVGDSASYEEIPFNLSLPQDIAEILKKLNSRKTIIIENFHYLNEEKQKQLAFDLRTFQELGVRFIILGVWREKNRLAQYNGDLLDRVIEIPVEPWTEEEFFKVAEKGANELKIRFNEGIVSECACASFSSIGVFQELLKEICIRSNIRETASTRIDIGDHALIKLAVETKAEEYSARHQRAIEAIATGNQSAGSQEGIQPLFLPYYLVKVILISGYNGLANGMRRSTIQEMIQKIHHRPNDVRPSDMSNLLYNLGILQSKKDISPPIIDYDKNTRMLQIVDSTFYFFLKHADLNAINEEIPNPLESS